MLRFIDDFDSALLDTTSQQYKDFSLRATQTLEKIINQANGISIDVTDLAAVIWYFREGSTIATAESVPLQGTDNRTVAETAINNVDPSTVDPKLTSIVATGILPTLLCTLCDVGIALQN